MGAPLGNQNAVGKTTGRKSAFDELKDAVWHSEKWEMDTEVPELQAKLKTGKYSVRDVFLAKALQGNEKILGIFANKLLADLVDIRGRYLIEVDPAKKEQADLLLNDILDSRNPERE